jgi:acyl-CoA thioester hydrolase
VIEQPQPPNPGNKQNLPLLAFEDWFEYAVRAQPHHTDYSNAVWHGTYITWMEEARIEYLRSIGIDFANLVALGCNLPVVELSVRYHRPILLGMAAIVRTRLSQLSGVRLNWDYQIQSPDGRELYTTARVTLVAVDRQKGKIMRQLPPDVENALVRIAAITGS